MAVAATTNEAIVLRTVRYGDSDVIAHLYTLEHGRRNAIAKGARSARSRLGARLEPTMVVTVLLRQGKGDLAWVQGVEHAMAHEGLRASYGLQQIAASALDMLGRLSVDHVANEPAFHLTSNLLTVLDSLDPVADPDRPAAVLLGYELKLLHVSGLAPHLGTCTRCGGSAGLSHWSARDGGVVCVDCVEAGDAVLDGSVHDAAAWAMQQPLSTIASAAELPRPADIGAASRRVVAPMCAEHAGFRLKQR